MCDESKKQMKFVKIYRQKLRKYIDNNVFFLRAVHFAAHTNDYSNEFVENETHPSLGIILQIYEFFFSSQF